MRLKEFLKFKEQPKYQNMCIGEGVISLQDASIPLDNICAIEITLPPKKPVIWGIALAILGNICFALPLEIFSWISLVLFLDGVTIALLNWYLNQKRNYSLIITVNSGHFYAFESLNIEYMRNLLREISRRQSTTGG